MEEGRIGEEMALGEDVEVVGTDEDAVGGSFSVELVGKGEAAAMSKN